MTAGWMIGIESRGDKGQAVAHSSSSVIKIGAERRGQPSKTILPGD